MSSDDWIKTKKSFKNIIIKSGGNKGKRNNSSYSRDSTNSNKSANTSTTEDKSTRFSSEESVKRSHSPMIVAKVQNSTLLSSSSSSYPKRHPVNRPNEKRLAVDFNKRPSSDYLKKQMNQSVNNHVDKYANQCTNNKMKTTVFAPIGRNLPKQTVCVKKKTNKSSNLTSEDTSDVDDTSNDSDLESIFDHPPLLKLLENIFNKHL